MKLYTGVLTLWWRLEKHTHTCMHTYTPQRLIAYIWFQLRPPIKNVNHTPGLRVACKHCVCNTGKTSVNNNCGASSRPAFAVVSVERHWQRSDFLCKRLLRQGQRPIFGHRKGEERQTIVTGSHTFCYDSAFSGVSLLWGSESEDFIAEEFLPVIN